MLYAGQAPVRFYDLINHCLLRTTEQMTKMRGKKCLYVGACWRAKSEKNIGLSGVNDDGKADAV